MASISKKSSLIPSLTSPSPHCSIFQTLHPVHKLASFPPSLSHPAMVSRVKPETISFPQPSRATGLQSSTTIRSAKGNDSNIRIQSLDDLFPGPPPQPQNTVKRVCNRY